MPRPLPGVPDVFPATIAAVLQRSQRRDPHPRSQIRYAQLGPGQLRPAELSGLLAGGVPALPFGDVEQPEGECVLPRRLPSLGLLVSRCPNVGLSARPREHRCASTTRQRSRRLSTGRGLQTPPRWSAVRTTTVTYTFPRSLRVQDPKRITLPAACGEGASREPSFSCRPSPRCVLALSTRALLG